MTTFKSTKITTIATMIPGLTPSSIGMKSGWFEPNRFAHILGGVEKPAHRALKRASDSN